ncbi:XdhC family protein [Rubellimicrobium roseum]|uniref:XdhC family protein n=1 Tax=Rubellimicrobium roseum TaxID=687525 RepID=A0A5C4N6N3_9RHOB|nr:XdhC family protein [Rubellimicrobium roseum]TNC61102.1 XdhC family protein [Rubellimicrobium roseum]
MRRADTMDWDDDLDDEVRPRLFAAARAGEAVGLGTIIAADGGPRPVGAQMVVTADMRRGVLSGGCIDADVARHAREVLAGDGPRRLVYGRGSPFLDLALPCGRRLEVLVERIEPDDPAVHALERFSQQRQRAVWLSDGHARACRQLTDEPSDGEPWAARVVFEPRRHLIVVGSDAFARAIAALGLRTRWEVTLVGALDSDRVPAGLRVVTGRLERALATCHMDRWTAVAVALHDTEAEVEALDPALRSDAFYVGALGSRSRLVERRERLQEAGLGAQPIDRLHAPIGLPLGGTSPREVALAVMAEVAQEARRSLLAYFQPGGLAPQAMAALAVTPRPDVRGSLLR